jgi:pimeloyl-ACP methyl ester carboxylesterase
MSYSERFVTAGDGLELFVRAYGDASSLVPVVCVPGLTRNSRDFELVSPALAADRLVLAVDLRGRGRSGYDVSGASYWVDVYASDVLSVVDAFGLSRVCLFGESLGGIVSMRIAAIAPERVAGVVLSDIGPDLDPAGVARIFSYAGKLPPVVTWDDAVAQCRMMSEGAAPGLTDERWLEIARQRFREDGDGTVVVDYDPGIATASVPMQSAADRWDDFGSLRDIPTLVVRGETSDVLAGATVDEMRARKPDLQSVEIGGRGHCPIPHEPECVAAVTWFVTSLPR